MKKILMSLACLFLLTACGGGETKKTTEKTDQSTRTTETKKSSESTTKESTTTSSKKEINALSELTKKFPDALLPTNIPRNEARSLNIASDDQGKTLKVSYYIMDEAMVLNDMRLNEQHPFASYKAETFKDESAAKTAVNVTFDKGGQKVDLGHNITGYSQGAAGSTFLNWQEGNWSLVVRASNVEGQTPDDTAKAVVEYLEKNALPAPKDAGQITIDLAGEGYQRNSVVWQKGKTVYTVTHEDPIPALEMAVSMKK